MPLTFEQVCGIPIQRLGRFNLAKTWCSRVHAVDLAWLSLLFGVCHVGLSPHRFPRCQFERERRTNPARLFHLLSCLVRGKPTLSP